MKGGQRGCTPALPHTRRAATDRQRATHTMHSAGDTGAEAAMLRGIGFKLAPGSGY